MPQNASQDLGPRPSPAHKQASREDMETPFIPLGEHRCGSSLSLGGPVFLGSSPLPSCLALAPKVQRFKTSKNEVIFLQRPGLRQGWDLSTLHSKLQWDTSRDFILCTCPYPCPQFRVSRLQTQWFLTFLTELTEKPPFLAKDDPTTKS